MAAAGELAIELVQLAAVERQQRPPTAVEPPTRSPLAAASDLAQRRCSASSPELSMAFAGLPAARNRAARWGIKGKRGCGGIGFRPASASQTRSYTASGVTFAGCGKNINGPDEYTGSVLARKLGRARIITGILRVCDLYGVC